MEGWQKYKLNDVCEIFDGPHATPQKQSQGNVFLGISSLNYDGRIQPEFFEYVSDEDYKKWTKRVRPKFNDIVFSYETKLGTAGIIPEKLKCCLGRRMGLLRSNDKILPRFLLYSYLSPYFQDQITEKTNYGSTVDRISIKELPDFDISVPSLAEQQAIAAVLSSLDDKIDLLHRQNKTLDALAQTLFRQWFVEEADGREKRNIAEFIDFNPKRKLEKGTIAPYIEMSALSSTSFSPSTCYDREFSSGTKFTNGDTLLARITPCLENGKAAFIQCLEDGETAWGSTEYIVLRPKTFLHPLFAYALVKTADFREYAESCLAGSSGRQRVELQHLMQYNLIMPTQLRIQQFNEFMMSLLPRLVKNANQIYTLTKLRDTLLPKLMNGEVCVEA